MDLGQVVKAFRLDWWRLTQIKKAVSCPVFLTLAVVLATLARVIGNYLLPLFVFVLVFFSSSMTGVVVFGHERRLRGKAAETTSRHVHGGQVVGRYVLVLAVMLLTFVVQSVCGAIMYLPDYPGSVISLSLALLMFSLCFNAVVLPLCYYFPANAKIVALVPLLIVFAVSMSLSIGIPESVWETFVNFRWSLPGLPMPWPAIIGMVVAMAVFALSCWFSQLMVAHRKP
ncbi:MULTISPECIES: ABC-2 transporter permease [unclassified Bifidobacterium]|uniref:ABC-2 transporter permease n=1 Tax=unclassified Bifidobacterium TaxID=2608897 RepID=UPI0023F88AAE|nr:MULTISPECIES: ABC-2 transporter permease [unclassified Bifidobacterium]WEV66495.1 ABC-2 transporter permease [Bifidobacterium sp. ESL0764]WEV76227.1 ABC-2 transporter permease [Bifidobacterium sp. ESL0800]